MTTVLVTGSREWMDYKTIDAFLEVVEKTKKSPFTLVEGGALGADRITRNLALKKGWKVTTVLADWGKFGDRAGPHRNQQMIDEHRPQVALCFRLNHSKGTSDCIKRLEKFQQEKDCPLKTILIAEAST
jgi:hypothetical protein